FPDYLEFLKNKFNFNPNIKILLDTTYGTAGPFAERVLEEFGFNVKAVNKEIKPDFPLGTPDPLSEQVQERIKTEVEESAADIGITLDGDGDRLGIVDSKGRFVPNDMLLSIFAKDLLLRKPGSSIVYNVLCSNIVKEEIEAAGGQAIMWKTGHSNIKEKMVETNALFGGEISGHFYFKEDFFGHDDAIYAMLKVLSILEDSQKKIDDYFDELNRYITSPEIVKTIDAQKISNYMQQVKTMLLERYPDAKVSEIDGIRLDFNDGMIVVRPSQTSPSIKIRFESKDKSIYENIRSFFSDFSNIP
ncbi:phosphomannomutase, partial [Candidatus Dojkabacteria bacterium]|nr:phosphomannomutase [Candidatus Dojkabacteria bacterium]